MYDMENEEGFDMDDEAELTGEKVVLILYMSLVLLYMTIRMQSLAPVLFSL